MKNKIKRAILVGAGKGGTGKSSLASLIALELRSRGHKTGILDVDLCGPSLPKILGVISNFSASDKGIEPAKTMDGLLLASVELFMKDKSTCLLWDDEKKKDFILTLLNDINWELDYLIIDINPGTSIESQTAIEFVSDNNIKSGIVFISSPQKVSLNDISKALSMARRLGEPVIGIIENYGVFKCSCGKEHYLFGKDNVKTFCKEKDVKYINMIPLVPELSITSDNCLNISTIPNELKPVISETVNIILKELN